MSRMSNLLKKKMLKSKMIKKKKKFWACRQQTGPTDLNVENNV